jgi:hypothetical protein
MTSMDGDARRYSEVRALFTPVVAAIAEGEQLPACPNWDVHDLVAHQVHQLEGALTGDFPLEDSLDAILAPDPAERARALARQEAWIANGVQAQRATPIAALVDEWAQLEADAPPDALSGLFPDITVHFFDLLGAARTRAHRTHPFVVAALAFWLQQSSTRLERTAQRRVRLEMLDGVGQREVIGESGAEVVVAGSAFELLRAITGRRSLRQAAKLQWERADEFAVRSFPAYGWRQDDLDE